MIAIARKLLQQLGVKDWTLLLNSVGNPADRLAYREALVNYLLGFKDDLDPDSQERLHRNPLRILDSKDPKTQAIAQAAPPDSRLSGTGVAAAF